MLSRGNKIKSVNEFYERLKSNKPVCYLNDSSLLGKYSSFYEASEASNLPIIETIEEIRCGCWYEAKEVK
jgi:hypothetical protein